MLKRKIKKGVILAAGDGGRLGSLTLTCPKVLLPMNDEGPLIKYAIEALVTAGISEIAIIVGYLGDKIIEVLGNGSDFGARLHYIYNSDYLAGNAVSVYKAKDWAQGEPVVLCMGDHIIDKKLIWHLLSENISGDTLCVDRNPALSLKVSEATKVAVDADGCITHIGKNLTYWDAIDTGVFLLTENFFRTLDELITSVGTDVELSNAIRCFISRGHRFHTCDVSDFFWMDVDTEEDLNMARR